MRYFSDREGFHKSSVTFNISADIWNGIVVFVKALIGKNLLAKDFPKQCPDGRGICGVDEQSFYIAASVVIPGAKNFLPLFGENLGCFPSFIGADSSFVIEENEQENFTYKVLDFIEFTYQHINDVRNGVYHEYFNHFELTFPETTNSKKAFVQEINEIFARNYIGFKLCDDGLIERIVDEQLLSPIKSQKLESTLAELIQDALQRFRNPRLNDRRIALEKLWDAFERLKTIINPSDKKASVKSLLESVSKGNDAFCQILQDECKMLTEIGNKFLIRHFEMNKIDIAEDAHIDYLFYRLYTLIKLLSTEVEIC